jgi:hypothetical protein
MDIIIKFFALLIIVGFIGLLLTFGVIVIGFAVAFFAGIFIVRKVKSFFNEKFGNQPTKPMDNFYQNTHKAQTTQDNENTTKTEVFEAEYVIVEKEKIDKI